MLRGESSYCRGRSHVRVRLRARVEGSEVFLLTNDRTDSHAMICVNCVSGLCQPYVCCALHQLCVTSAVREAMRER